MGVGWERGGTTRGLPADRRGKPAFPVGRTGQPVTVPEIANYRVEAPPGQMSPPLVSEDAAHDWAAVNRRGREYVIHVKTDDHEVARKRYQPRPT